MNTASKTVATAPSTSEQERERRKAQRGMTAPQFAERRDQRAVGQLRGWLEARQPACGDHADRGGALLWLADSFWALVLTLPVKKKAAGAQDAPAKAGGKSWWARWMPSWRIRWGAGAYKLNFDLHRAGALWIWGVIVIVAFTSFSINLYREVFYPVMSKVSTTTPGPYETLKPAPLGSFIEPKIGFATAIEIARQEAVQLGIKTEAGGIWYGGDFPFYNVSFFDPDDETGAMGMGLSNVYVSSESGEVLGLEGVITERAVGRA